MQLSISFHCVLFGGGAELALSSDLPLGQYQLPNVHLTANHVEYDETMTQTSSEIPMWSSMKQLPY